MKVKIGDDLIGKGEPCYIIAEAGANHNGSVEMAKMGKCCGRSGSSAMKFQTFKEEKVTNRLLIQIYITNKKK